MTDRGARAVGAELDKGAAIRPSIHDHLDAPVAARATKTELRDALGRQRVAMVVWKPEDGEILLANPATAEIVGRPLDQIIGSNALEFVEPDYKIELAKQILSVGVVDAYRARRRLRGKDDDVLYVWTRAIKVDEERLAISVLSLGRDLAGLGGSGIESPFGATVAVAVGMVDRNWEIQIVSSDLKEIAGVEATEARGKSLLELIDLADARRVRDAERHGPGKPIALHGVRLREPNKSVHDVCLLIGEPRPGTDRVRVFGLVGWPRSEKPARTARERELEDRLRRISAEVRAAGLIEILGHIEGVEPSQLGDELTTRQLEIVEMLLHGARVSTIARTLYISPSTVRNHLSTIYRHFNVHSQAELLEKLRMRPVESG